jgi:hypothetical protein
MDSANDRSSPGAGKDFQNLTEQYERYESPSMLLSKRKQRRPSRGKKGGNNEGSMVAIRLYV